MKQRHLLPDLMRGLAALLVCAGHLRAAMLVDMADAHDPFGLHAALYMLTGMGHQAVIVFFVLSGYLVGGSVISAAQRFNWRLYVLARLSRLWVVLVPCLLLTALIDQLIWSVDPSVFQGAAARSWHSGPQEGQYDASVLTWLGNLLFLQTVAVPVFGSNSPLWSLANEFWYYLLFPLAWLAGRTRSWPMLVAGVCVLAMMPVEMRWGSAVWVMGAGVHLALQHRATSGSHSQGLGLLDVVAVLACGAAWLLSKWGNAHGLPMSATDLALGLGVALVLWRLLPRRSPFQQRPVLRRAVEHLSNISFSLYLSLFPVVMLIGTMGRFTAGRLQPGWSAWGLWLLCLALLLLVGHTMWLLFERRTDAVRNWMLSLTIPEWLNAR